MAARRQSILASDVQTGLTFEPVHYPSLAESVLAELRRAIINGSIPPGERLLETSLADQFEVSRATLRQALTQLRVEGLIDIRPRRGAVVTRMSSEAAREVCTVRGILEGWAARRACAELTDDQLQRMRAIASSMGEYVLRGDVYKVTELDIELHACICRCEPNQYLWERWQSLNALHGALLSSRVAYYNYDSAGIVRRHQLLVDTIAQRDPDTAEEAVRFHYIRPFEEVAEREVP